MQEMADEFTAVFVAEILPAIKTASYMGAAVARNPEYYDYETQTLADQAIKNGKRTAKLVKKLITGRLAFIALQQPDAPPNNYWLAIVNPDIVSGPFMGAITWLKPIVALPWKMILKTTIKTALAAGALIFGNSIAEGYRLKKEAELTEERTKLQNAQTCAELPPDQRAACLASLQKMIKEDGDTPLDKWIKQGGKAVGEGTAAALGPVVPLLLLLMFAREKFKK